jgi:hypothetical protein
MGRSAPDWPALMRRDLARLYVDMTAAEFERAVAAGHLPSPALGDRWSRAEIDAHLDRLIGTAPDDWRAKCKLFKKDAA